MKAMVWPHVTLDRDGRAARRPAGPADRSPGRRCSRPTGTARSRSSASRSAPTRDGRLTAIRHEKLSITSPFDDWAEPATGVSSQLYALRALPRRAPADPRQHDDADLHPRARARRSASSRSRRRWTSSRYQLGIDPVELRLRNHTPVDPRGNPWSSDGLRGVPAPRRRALRLGRRDPAPRARRDGDWLIGTGHGRRRLPDRVLHARAARPGPDLRRRQRRRADRHAGVRHRRLDRWRPRSAPTRSASRWATIDVPGRRHRPAQQHRGRGLGRRGMVSAAVHAAGTALREQLIALAVGRPSSRRCTAPTPASVTVAGRAPDLARAPGRERHVRRAARPQPHGRRRGDRAAGARRRSTPRTGC